MHVITVASRNLWLLLETTHDRSRPPSCESQSARIKPSCESQPHLLSRNLRLRVVTKNVTDRDRSCESQPRLRVATTLVSTGLFYVIGP
ncbi:hypothetical protein HanIR_Chr06g0271001 [Helianthus annuus]|nr:hypothetical protein HanIR_Chr06g0271001 [Helianthus annuus]